MPNISLLSTEVQIDRQVGSLNIQYILFDLDDTLYDYSSGLFAEVRARIEAWMERVLQLPLEEVQSLRRDYLKAYGTTLAGLVRHHPEADRDDYLDAVHQVDVSRFLTPRPELAAMIAALPVKKGIFTNGTADWADRILRQLGIRQHFGPLIDIRATHYVGKPWPEAYQQALDLLHCAGAECVFVDDQPRNLQPAAAFGMRTVLVRPGGVSGDGVEFAVDDILDAGAVLQQIL